jgi:hypothetical protein|tara:strand:- start:7098 stop:7487 length:390 start_codon:yes stop_codon:yes gene_type:complete
MRERLRDLGFLRWLTSALETIPEGFVVVDGRVIYWKYTSTSTTQIEVYSSSTTIASWSVLELDGDAMKTTWVGIGRHGEMKGTASISQTSYVLAGKRYKLLSMDCQRDVPAGEISSYLPREMAGYGGME